MCMRSLFVVCLVVVAISNGVYAQPPQNVTVEDLEFCRDTPFFNVSIRQRPRGISG